MGHIIEECRTLQREVGKLIAAGRPTRVQVGRAPIPKGVHTIAGGFGGGGVTSAARKRYARAVNTVAKVPFGFSHPDITFSSDDFVGIKPHLDDPIVILLRVNQLNVQRVLLDQGSSADIIYGGVFDRLGLSEADLTPYAGTLVGFAGEQKTARECYCNAVDRYGKRDASVGHRCNEVDAPEENLDPRGEGRVNRPTPIEETNELKFGEKILKIRTRLTEAQEQRLSKLLGENLDLFAWSHKDMPGIDPNFICHRLALNPGIKPVTQTRRRMGDEKEKAIQQEVNKLLAADFIWEIKYPTWLANVVMVKKANGK
ncbi:uncharacterized protein LOC130719444 [Lotus japonicus]|uniref:uncharacterized protein LOC130719444 n=1 Tax=Lotus japonicus TaxID=34305 RepID=UPI0025837123|nr:uncharacterized protein LOC130719444 [Lotus japonicus]